MLLALCSCQIGAVPDLTQVHLAGLQTRPSLPSRSLCSMSASESRCSRRRRQRRCQRQDGVLPTSSLLRRLGPLGVLLAGNAALGGHTNDRIRASKPASGSALDWGELLRRTGRHCQPTTLLVNTCGSNFHICRLGAQCFCPHVCSAGAAAGTGSEVLTPVSALAALLPGSFPAATSATAGLPTVTPGETETAAAGEAGSPTGSAAPGSSGWGGITARLQRLRAELQQTQARLQTAEQVQILYLSICSSHRHGFLPTSSAVCSCQADVCRWPSKMLTACASPLFHLQRQ